MNRPLRLVALAVISVTAADRARADLQVWTVRATRRVLREVPAGRGTAVKLAAGRMQSHGRMQECRLALRQTPGSINSAIYGA